MSTNEPIWQALGILFQSHPWHGVSPGETVPEVVTCFIEVVPSDTVKYELDKMSGLLRVDRPQRYSNVAPSLYGFLPQTLCGDLVAERCMERTGRAGVAGDDDPLDICVLTERPIAHGNILVDAVPIGGLRMVDAGEADDKIIAVLKGDPVYGSLSDTGSCPPELLRRHRHYFLTYKRSPDDAAPPAEILEVYGRAEAHEVIRRSRRDYLSRFEKLLELVTAAIGR